MAQKRANVGAQLVECFRLLLDFQPCEELPLLVNEHMLSLPDKRTFQCVMIYILRLLDPVWYSQRPERILSKQDERLFYNTLSDNFKALRKEFPEVGLPLLTPSSMVCFHGERCRETLKKITKAVMLHLMKRDNYQANDEVDSMDCETLEEECNNLRKEIQLKREGINKVLSLQRKVLQLVVSTEYWDDSMREKMLDVNHLKIIPEMKKMYDDSLEQLKSLKVQLQPYFNHMQHEYELGDCECSQKFRLSENKVSQICEFLWETKKNFIKIDIMELNLLSEIRKLKQTYFESIDLSVALKDTSSTLIEKLENLVSACDRSPELDANVLLKDSPLAVNLSPPAAGDSPVYFTPVVARDWMKLKKHPIKVDLQSVADLMMPPTIGVSPVRPLTGRVIAKAQIDRAKPNDCIMSIVERMRSRATPCKSGNWNLESSVTKTSFASSSFASLLAKNTMSCEKYTPASKAKFPVLAQTTGRRQTMGFIKPTNCIARRQLKTDTPVLQRKTFQCVSEKETKSKPNDSDQDKVLDMIVQEMVAGRDYENDGSFSSCNTDILDSLHTTESCSSSLGVRELQTEMAGRDCEMAPGALDLVESVKSEIKRDNEELADLVNSILGEDSASLELDNDEEMDVFLDQEMTKSLKLLPEQKPEILGKPKRDSLNLLIEKFNAIKRTYQKNSEES